MVNLAGSKTKQQADVLVQCLRVGCTKRVGDGTLR